MDLGDDFLRGFVEGSTGLFPKCPPEVGEGYLPESVSGTCLVTGVTVFLRKDL